MKRALTLLLPLLVLVIIFIVLQQSFFKGQDTTKHTKEQNQTENEGGILETLNPLTIAALREGNYPGEPIIIEETLAPGGNYDRYIASYKSEGNKIYALLTVPHGDPSAGSGQGKPATGWPVIIFNHGFIPPAEYRTTERYIAYTDGFSRNGYIVFRSDYRGHGSSEGKAEGGYGNNGYTIDVLNALASIKKYKDADPKRIGMWGHSMGGFITLRAMVVRKDIKAGVVWGGVVASYPDLINNWRRPIPGQPSITPGGARRWRQILVDQYGEPKNGVKFWDSISSNAYLQDISGPVQLHHGTNDESVPVAFSTNLAKQMESIKKPVELYTYEGDDHDITANFNTAMERSIAFFDKYVK
jgi:uncharacterized protein